MSTVSLAKLPTSLHPVFTDSERGPAKGKVGVEISQLSDIRAAKRVLVIEDLGCTVQTYHANCAPVRQKYEDHQHGVKTVS